MTLAFLVAGLGCAFAGLCYAEFASMIPIAGSAYTYSYATMGELVAWIIGWDLVPRVRGRRRHGRDRVERVLQQGARVRRHARAVRVVPLAARGQRGRRARDREHSRRSFILLVLSALLIRGMQESAIVNSIIVVTKVSIVLMVIVIGWGFMNPANHTPYIPAATTYTTPQGITHPYGGIMGILGAAGVVFFAFIGFDAVSTAAQEAKNPKRDMPIGILGSLVVCTILYVLFSHVLSGVATVEDFRTAGKEASVAFAISKYMIGYEWLSQVRDDRDSGRLLVGHPRDAAGAVARLLLDEPRRPGAEDLLRGAPDVPDAVEGEHAVLRVHRRVRRRSSRRASSAR